MIDTFITGLVICLSTYLMGLVNHLQYLDWKSMMKNFFGRKDEETKRIKISSKPSTNQYGVNGLVGGNPSPVFNAILNRIKHLDCDESNIVEMCEFPLQTSSTKSQNQQHLLRLYGAGALQTMKKQGIDNLEEESKNRTNLIVNQSKYFKLANDVFGTVRKTQERQSTPNMNQYTAYPNQANNAQQEEAHFEICIESTVLSMNELRSIVQTWVKDYLKCMEPDKDLHYFQYQPSSQDSITSHSRPQIVPLEKYAEFKFESNKRFENVFFPEKKDLIEQLDHFMNNESWYKEVGLSHTLGFLFHGEPGCGKTSTIKAIAKYTHRHIVSISLKKLKNQKELFDVFYNDYINDRKIPIKKRLYVLEDIDCSNLEDIVGDRSKKDKDVSTKDQGTVTAKKIIPGLNINLALPQSMGQPGIVDFPKEKSELTLADILEALDGVMEMDGRMLIITTNYPEKLDPALVRPGRIDVQLKFGRCTLNSLIEICDRFYRTLKTNISRDVNTNEIWPKGFDKTSLPEHKWTPAEVTQILVRNIKSPIKGLQELQG